MDPMHVRCSCAMHILTACKCPRRSHLRERREHHLCFFLKSKLKSLFKKKKCVLGDIDQQGCCSIPPCPAPGWWEGRGTHRIASPFPKSPASKALPTLEIVKIGRYSDRWPHRRGYFHFISSQLHPAHGRWCRHPLPSGASSGHRESVKDKRGLWINPVPCSFNPLPAKLSSHPLFRHLYSVFQGAMNCSSITPC